MNTFLVILFGIALLVLIAWMIKVNNDEKSRLEDKLNNDYPVREKHQEDADPEDLKSD
ncbi:hypothetical protein [Flavihumibacter fluvii]|jgi:hypothetical protein|uniref:hypothetical protein n=1 Tax=Flavihumibacter fluvii TaxID=2838157 RepID=UPI001BDE93D9|nr:hypothetical protein [Flavihumibacter fluvii]ULQ53423.1 hypothetical protein KJS93_03705 [Flavihumibacter fluvii]